MRLPDSRFTIHDLRPRRRGSLLFVSPATRHPSPESGVALIITVIMLSVITFLAVAFLALSGREKNAVKVTTDQTTARLAADAAMVRAQNELLAGILASYSIANFDLLVSTNYVNYNGYDSGVSSLTNANYYYQNGSPLSGNLDPLQNLTNLYFSPRPPVFITNRLAANSMEFRYYIDLNRNGRHDRSGFWGVTNNLNQPLLDNSNQFVKNHVVGDPEWIGGTERIEYPHSSSNKFVYRFAYAAVPVGKTLDVNYVHNQAFNPNKTSLDTLGRDFFRNQGVGSWEINLAAFFYDLNSNPYAWGGLYTYDPLTGNPVQGTAFADAGEFYRFRLNGDGSVPRVASDYLNNLASASAVLSATEFTSDFVDGYSAGPLLRTNLGGLSPDPDVSRMLRPWSGADNRDHLFTSQDFFNPRKSSPGFVSRLNFVSTTNSTYDRYTYYRMLSQLGAESAPEDGGKLNINYKNVGGLSATNQVLWTPLDFFTNAASRLLTNYTQLWLDENRTNFVFTFGTTNAFGIHRIPVWVSNRWAYTPSVQRVLQLAANICDATTNRITLYPDLPSVFKPVFLRQGDDIYITGYTNVDAVSGASDPVFSKPLDIQATNDLAAVPTGVSGVNIYGVPWIIGAKKGLPNFNEVAMQPVFDITRRVQITRSAASARADISPRNDPSARTNISYVIGVSNVVGVELWNSYATTYPRAVDVFVTSDLSMRLTNNLGVDQSLPPNLIAPVQTNIPASAWKGYSTYSSSSFIVPMRTNAVLIPHLSYTASPSGFHGGSNITWDTSQTFLMGDWGWQITNRFRCIMVDTLTRRVIDYVHFAASSTTNLTSQIQDPDGEGAMSSGKISGMWSTNRLGNAQIGPPQWIVNQVNLSRGDYGIPNSTDWNNNSYDKMGNQKLGEIQSFAALYHLGGWPNLKNTNTHIQVPFTPTKKVYLQQRWQANDPLVHYLADDLVDLTKANIFQKVVPPNDAGPDLYKLGVGRLNERYDPWEGQSQNPNEATRYKTTLKDPAVKSSDAWVFVTNAYPNIGWLGRVHRGSPWQTVYMKSSDVNTAFNPGVINEWQAWASNPNYEDAMRTRPITDRVLFDVFTSAFNDNAGRGQLPINQTNLAAWSAVFSGLLVLSNSTEPAELRKLNPILKYDPQIIPPAGIYDPQDTNSWTQVVRLVSGINAERSRMVTNGTLVASAHPNNSFQTVGDLLSVPELTEASPFLAVGTNSLSLQKGINDTAYEWLPQQIMSLVRLGEPRFVIYAYGQALRPAENSIVTAGGQFFGLCTNYQITAEVAARAVVRVEGSPDPTQTSTNLPARKRYPPRLIIESYNYLAPD